MPLPFAPLLDDVLVNLPSADRAAGASIVFSTNQVTYITVDLNVTAFTGGTSPTAIFTVDRYGADNVWYNIWSTTIASPTAFTVDLGPGFVFTAGINVSQHAVFTTQGRLSWTYTGSPTSVTFSATALGR